MYGFIFVLFNYLRETLQEVDVFEYLLIGVSSVFNDDDPRNVHF